MGVTGSDDTSLADGVEGDIVGLAVGVEGVVVEDGNGLADGVVGVD